MPPWLIQTLLTIVGTAATARSQKGANDTDLVKLRSEANRSGFHPLTVLRATGGAGFTRGVHGGLSRLGTLASGASRMVGAYTANQRQKVDDAYTSVFRGYQIAGMHQNLQIGAKQLAQKPPEPEFFEVPLVDPRTGNVITNADGITQKLRVEASEVQDFWVPVRNQQTGQLYAYPSPDLFDMGPTEFATGWGLHTLFQQHAKDGTDFLWNLPGYLGGGSIGLPGNPLGYPTDKYGNKAPLAHLPWSLSLDGTGSTIVDPE